MKLISNIGSENQQAMTVIRENGKKFNLSLFYSSQQAGWFLTLEDAELGKTIKNIRIVTSGNLLHQWRNILKYGISCAVDDNQEPFFQNDFSSGRANLYVLTRSEVEAYTEGLNGQVST